MRNMSVSADRMPAFELAALTRIAADEVTTMAGHYLDNGFLLPDHLARIVDQLILGRLAVTGDGDMLWDCRAVRLTEAGQQRYRFLRAAAEPRTGDGAADPDRLPGEPCPSAAGVKSQPS
ncbi:MAG: hypothetical protein ACRDTC_19350 [Pseudonocardiaceae bacterium]